MLHVMMAVVEEFHEMTCTVVFIDALTSCMSLYVNNVQDHFGGALSFWSLLMLSFLPVVLTVLPTEYCVLPLSPFHSRYLIIATLSDMQ